MLLLVLTVVAYGTYYTVRSTRSNTEPATTLTQQLVLGEQVFTVDIAATPGARHRGLGGRYSLDPQTGMLFVFPDDDTHGIWMRDMHVSIDIIWLSQEGAIVDVAEHVSPETYPDIFYPKVPARYVLEVPAGTCETFNVAVGTTVELSVTDIPT